MVVDVVVVDDVVVVSGTEVVVVSGTDVVVVSGAEVVVVTRVVVVVVEVGVDSVALPTATPMPAPASNNTNAIDHTAAGLMMYSSP